MVMLVLGTSDPESKLDVKGKVLISNGGTWGHTHGERTGGTTPQSIIDSSQLQLHAPNNYGNDAGFKLYMGCFELIIGHLYNVID